MLEERQSFEVQIIKNDKEMSNLKKEVINLRSKVETEKNTAVGRICYLLEKQKATALEDIFSEREEDPQENIIN